MIRDERSDYDRVFADSETCKLHELIYSFKMDKLRYNFRGRHIQIVESQVNKFRLSYVQLSDFVWRFIKSWSQYISDGQLIFSAIAFLHILQVNLN
jgi:hypothetical protein